MEIATPLWTVDFDVDHHEYSIAGTVDDEWCGTDPNGHEHVGATIDETTKAIYDEVMDPDDGPYNEFSHFECRMCGEVVEPGRHPAGTTRISSTYSATIEGPLHGGRATWTFEGEAAEALAMSIAETRGDAAKIDALCAAAAEAAEPPRNLILTP